MTNNCSNCSKDLSDNNDYYACNNCSAKMCSNCMNETMGICPHCSSAMDKS